MNGFFVFIGFAFGSLLKPPSIVSCAKYDPVTGEKIIIEPNPQKKAEEFRDKQGGIFGDINNSKKNTTTFDFATSNVLWRATLKSLDFLPLVNADYSGGIIIYDWYSENLNSKDSLKITVRFLNNEVRSDSLQIIAHKKICDQDNKCIIEKREHEHVYLFFLLNHII